jgi:ribosomal protein S18 acetylase RimI-like enzyme
MTGPVSLTTNDTTGILTRGFNDSPVFMMPYNFPYYERLLQVNNFSATMTLFSYTISHESLPADIYRKAEVIESRLKLHQVNFRQLDMKKYDEEISRLQPVYNKVNEHNWGFMPLDKDAFSYMASDLKKLVDKEGVLVAEHNDNLIGFAVTVPDYSQVFKKMKSGKLFPSGWWHLITGARKINRIRIIILGVLPHWRGLGIDWCLYARVAAYAKKRNFNSGEACYVMENNSAMNKMMKALGSTVTKEYKLYQKPI